MGEHDNSLGRALSTRIRRQWFLYIAVSVFYCLDIYLTLLVWGKGTVGESNPVNRYLLQISGPQGWVAFRVLMLFTTTAALLSTFALASVALRDNGQERDIDRVEEVALGSVMLFYAIALVHNLMSIAAPLPRPT